MWEKYSGKQVISNISKQTCWKIDEFQMIEHKYFRHLSASLHCKNSQGFMFDRHCAPPHQILLNLPESFPLRLQFPHPAENYQRQGPLLNLNWFPLNWYVICNQIYNSTQALVLCSNIIKSKRFLRGRMWGKSLRTFIHFTFSELIPCSGWLNECYRDRLT